MAAFTLLGSIVDGIPIAVQIARTYGPEAWEFLAQPGKLGRVGDAMVWNSESGQKVIAVLDGLVEGQDRINSAIAGVEQLQLASTQALGVVQTFSMMTLGVTSLTGVYMAWRLSALNRRLEDLSHRIKDVEARLNAQDKAHLLNSVQTLRSYEQKENASDLKRAKDEAQHAANIYGELAMQEAANGQRMPVLNYRSRYYLLALLTEIQCLLLDENHRTAMDRIDEETSKLRAIATTTFAQTIGQNPESLLDPNLKADGITLDFLAELYGQAQYAGAVSGVDVQNANDMFEYVRVKVFKRGPWLGSSRKSNLKLLNSVRYAAACLEDTNRVLGLNLLIREFAAKNLSFQELVRQLRDWRANRGDRPAPGSGQTFAYTFT